MIIYLRSFAFVLIVGSVHAQNNLPHCLDGATTWNNCVGTATWDSGHKYVGDFMDDKPNGQGTLTYSEGDKYVGEFKDGKKHGQGTYTHANGEKYVGNYKDDKQHGQGTYTHANGEKYVGYHKDGKEHGQGTLTYPKGEKYVGEFKDGKQHGQGTLYSSNGSIINQGLWANNTFVRSEPVQQATLPKQEVERLRSEVLQQAVAPSVQLDAGESFYSYTQVKECIKYKQSFFSLTKAQRFIEDLERFLKKEQGYKDLNEVIEKSKKELGIKQVINLGTRPDSPEITLLCQMYEELLKRNIDLFYKLQGSEQQNSEKVDLKLLLSTYKNNILKFNESYKNQNLSITDGSLIFNKITQKNRIYYGQPAFMGLKYWYDSPSKCIADRNKMNGNTVSSCQKENIIEINYIEFKDEKSKIQFLCENSELEISENTYIINFEKMSKWIPGQKIALTDSVIKDVFESKTVVLERCQF